MTREWIEVPLSAADKLGQWAIWAGTKTAIALPGIFLYSWKQISRLSLHLAEGCERFYCQLLIPLDAIPYGGMRGNKLIEIEAKPINSGLEIQEDLIALLEGKHVILVGGTGDGKTTTAMFLAYSIGGRIKIYDADAAADEWLGLEVVGRGADFASINQAMTKDLEELQRRTILRAKQGSHACDGLDSVTIAEEFPLLVDEVESAARWLISHGKRGRRVKRFIIAIAQNDTVANFGIQGDAGVLDCFRIIRLGKKAQAHARKLKNEELWEWLKGDRGRILIDDIPVQLPPYREIKRVIDSASRGLPSLPAQLHTNSDEVFKNSQEEFSKTPETTPETTENQGFQPLETSTGETFQRGEIGLLERILTAFEEERSDDWIAKHVIMASQSIGYQKARQKIEAIREMWG